MKKLYTVGVSATLNLALPSLLISILNGMLASFSDKYVLVLGVYYKLQTFRMNMGIMLLGTVLSWTIPEKLIGLFTANSETIAVGVTALHIISLGGVISAISVTCSGTLEGLEKGYQSLFISLLRYVAIILSAAYLFSKLIGANGIWFAFCFTEFVSAAFSIFITRLKPQKVC